MWTAVHTPGDGEAMAYEMTVGLHVSDQESYARYRAEIAPLLEAAAGWFRYDFEVARTLKGAADGEINRLFILQFPDLPSKEVFFSDPRYLAIRKRLFEPSVTAATIIAEGATFAVPAEPLARPDDDVARNPLKLLEPWDGR